ncbi:MAG TPA: hypothetical protein VKB31_00340 [Trueperaceae bacterium]|nr:hypothetical protein [Trueperaceae bacterium]
MRRTRTIPARPALLSVALALLLAGCTAVVRPGNPATAPSQGVIVWAHLGLQFEFPGVVVEQRQAGPHHFDTVFRSDASLYGVYGDVDSRMRAHGWHRIRYQEHRDRITAEYARGGQRARVDVRQEGRSGRYRLTIDD